MTNDLAPYNPAILAESVYEKDGEPRTNSLRVAERFGKLHKNVLQAIDKLECSAAFRRLNFQPRDYVDERGKKQRLTEMTFDGFVFLVMGFTGSEAAKSKEAYIGRFNAMREHIAKQARLPAIDTNDPLQVKEYLVKSLQENIAFERRDREQRKLIQALEPDAGAFRVLNEASARAMDFIDTAKVLKTTREAVFAMLTSKRWIYKSKAGRWLAYESAVRAGYMEVIETEDGKGCYDYAPLITVKGRKKLAQYLSLISVKRPLRAS